MNDSPNFLILISHFEEWVQERKNPNFTLYQYDKEKVVSTLEDGYAFVRTRFLDKYYKCSSQDDAKLLVLYYTYQYAYIDINGLVNIQNPDDTTSSVADVENKTLFMMVSDGYADY